MLNSVFSKYLENHQFFNIKMYYWRPIMWQLCKFWGVTRPSRSNSLQNTMPHAMCNLPKGYLNFVKYEEFSLTWSCESRQRDTTSSGLKFRLNNLAVKGLMRYNKHLHFHPIKVVTAAAIHNFKWVKSAQITKFETQILIFKHTFRSQ